MKKERLLVPGTPMCHSISRVLLLLFIFLHCIPGNFIKAQTYGNVAMGGCGFISGIVTSKIDPNKNPDG